uniref:lysosomal proton-coupled steroid conjugate and bile acid symporter SLC46A3 n=1 Tax=Centroberyx gerrardi TaxID=166262 RepID=UPI003AAEB5FB
MGCVDLIEPVVGINAFSLFMTYPLLQQYVYRRLWLQLSGAPYSFERNNSHCADNSTNLTFIHVEVQKEASLFLLYTELCFLFPSLLSSPLLVSYSDVRGRKAAIVPPLLGNLLFTSCYFVVSGLALNLSYLLGAAFISGVLGGPAALVGGCFAYVADRCEQGISQDRNARARTVRMAGLDMILGLLSGLASLSTGFFIHAAGFTWPGLTAALLHLLNLGYVLCVLRESLNPPSSSSSFSFSCLSSSLSSSSFSPKVGSSCLPERGLLIGQLQGVYLMFASGTRRRNTVLGLMLAAFALYKVSKLGGMSIFLLYELSKPLCWSEVLIGYGSALTTVIYLGSFAGVSILSRCLRDTHIVLLGLLSVSAGLLMAAFAKSTLFMFLVRLPLVLSAMPTAVLRSMMSKAVLSSEQGAMFACIAFVEMLSMGVALMVFNSTYAASVSWFSGFSFLLASCLAIIPAVLIGVLMYLDPDEEEDMIRLTAEEDNLDTDCSGGTLNLIQWEST